MKKTAVFLLTALLLFGAGSLLARWIRVFGGPYHDFMTCALELTNRDIVAAGSTQILSGVPVRAWLSRLTPAGGVRWQKTYSLTDNNGVAALVPTADGGMAMLSNANAAWLLKLNGDGLIEWQKLYTGSPTSPGGGALETTTDGGYVMAGGQFYGSPGGLDVIVFKLTSSGSIQWQRRYGGDDYDELKAVHQTADGGYVLAVRTNDFSAGQMDYMVLKLTASGDVSWCRTYGGSGYDEIESIRQTADGGYIVVGYTYSFGAGNQDAWVLKLSSSGTIQWQKTYGGVGGDMAMDVYPTPAGDYLVAGTTSSYGTGAGDIWVFKLNSQGSILWQKTYGGGGKADFGRSIQPTLEGGAIVGANAQSVGYGQMDFLVLKLLPDGTVDASCPSLGYVIGTSSATVLNSGAAAVTASLSTAAVSFSAVNAAGIATDAALGTRMICQRLKKGSIR